MLLGIISSVRNKIFFFSELLFQVFGLSEGKYVAALQYDVWMSREVTFFRFRGNWAPLGVIGHLNLLVGVIGHVFVAVPN